MVGVQSGTQTPPEQGGYFVIKISIFTIEPIEVLCRVLGCVCVLVFCVDVAAT